MTPGARLQAAIELLAAIHEGSSPADRAAAAYFRGRRYIGGQDRRDIIDRVYAVLRHRARLEWWLSRVVGDGTISDRWRMIAALALLDGWPADRIAGAFDGGQYRPQPLDRRESEAAHKLAGKSIDHPDQPNWVRREYPQWLDHQLRNLLGPRFDAEMAALGVEAPLDLRVNTLKATRPQAIAALAESNIVAVPTPLSPIGLRVRGRPPLATLPCFRDGLVEVQDEGSQVAALLSAAKPGEQVVDLCAGGGGKTLAMAAMMENKGQIFATDDDKRRLAPIHDRLKRAGARNVQVRSPKSVGGELDDLAGRMDLVLIDAPCTGTGAWRRNPDAKWRMRPGALEQRQKEQAEILDRAVGLLKPGGRIVYVTCSVLDEENGAQARAFLSRYSGFSVQPPAAVGQALGERAFMFGKAARVSVEGILLTPRSTDTDGFFVSVMRSGG
jgi:16S rRNA (cytosine967-C5)-methyltransferase